MLPLNAFVRTNYGFVMEPQTSLIQHRIRSVGIGLTDRVEGPFDLRVHRIWATNGLSEEEEEEEKRICGENALPVGEGAHRTYTLNEVLNHQGRTEDVDTTEQQQQQQSDSEKPKGLQGLRSRWDE